MHVAIKHEHHTAIKESDKDSLSSPMSSSLNSFNQTVQPSSGALALQKSAVANVVSFGLVVISGILRAHVLTLVKSRNTNLTF